MRSDKKRIRHQMDGKLVIQTVILSFIASIGLIKAKNCPALMCDCKWTKGKETAFCDNKSLDSIPIGIPVSTQVLNISDNKIKRLGAQVFRERGLINLQKIFMSKCNLEYISNDSLTQLTNLIEIDFCNNLLQLIPTLSLQKCKSLRKLFLCLNPIRVIKSNSFENLNNLVYIDLSNCQIDSVESNAFKGLIELRYLKLESNRLTTLSANALTDLQILHSFDLNGNQWKCDCQLKYTIKWILNHKIPQTIWPKCLTPPQLKGHSWNDLNLEEVWCPPLFHSKTNEYFSQKGQNITFECIVSGNPLPFIEWKFSKNDHDKIMAFDREKRYKISFEQKNSTFIASYLTINDLTSTDTQTVFCLVSAKDKHYYQNYSLIVKQTKKSDIINDYKQLKLNRYFYYSLVVLIVVFLIIIVFIIRLRKYWRISSRLSPKINSIDILKDCKNSEMEMKYMLSKKPEIALISDIVRDTNHIKHYRFGLEALTPDITKLGPQYSTFNNKVISFNNTSLLMDSNKTNPISNSSLNSVSLEYFSDNCFKYKKLKSSHHIINDSESNESNKSEGLLVDTRLLNERPLTYTTLFEENSSLILKNETSLKPLLNDFESKTIILEEKHLERNLKKKKTINSNNDSISMSEV